MDFNINPKLTRFYYATYNDVTHITALIFLIATSTLSIEHLKAYATNVINPASDSDLFDLPVIQLVSWRENININTKLAWDATTIL